MFYFSYNSASNIIDVFKALFPDSAIAHGMKCTELSYLINFEIAPYLQQITHGRGERSTIVCDLFKVSLNNEIQQEQMDFIVGYFKHVHGSLQHSLATLKQI